MPDFTTSYNRIVLESRVGVLARAYARARGELDEHNVVFDPDPKDQEAVRTLELEAMPLLEHLEHAETRKQHETLVRTCIDPLARHWLGHHLFGPQEMEGLMHLLAREDKRFAKQASEVVKGHATYAMRYASRELEDLLTKFPVVRAAAPGAQQPNAWLPLFRHFVREAIVRAYEAQRERENWPTPDWDAVLEMVVSRLENDLRSEPDLVGSFAERSDSSRDDEDAHDWSADDFSDETELWSVRAQSVGSSYDRDDARHIRCLIEWVTDRAAESRAPVRARQARKEFSHQLRLRFACTAYTHIVRGITTRIVEEQRLPEVLGCLKGAVNACGEASEAAPDALKEVRKRVDEAIAACTMPFAALAMRKIDDARAKLRIMRRNARPGSALQTQLDSIGERLDDARKSWDLFPADIQGHLLQALTRCGVLDEADSDCGDALSWLRNIHHPRPFGATFEERLARARAAVADKIREAWDAAVAERLENFLAFRDGCVDLNIGLSAVEYLERSPIWDLPQEEWADALAEESLAREFARLLSADQASIMEDLNVNLAAKRIDYSALRRELAVSPDFLKAWDLNRTMWEDYEALRVVLGMRRNAPKRVFKYFTAICRLAENMGMDAETTMDLEQWLATTERLFASLEGEYFDEAFATGDRFVGLGDWIERRRELHAGSTAQALLPYYSLWNRLLAGALPTSRAVPYLKAVRPALRPWFKKQTVSSSSLPG